MLCIVYRGAAACDFDRDTLDYFVLGLGPNGGCKFVAHLNNPLGRARIHEPDKLSGAAVVCDFGDRDFGRSAATKSIPGDDTDPDWSLP